MVDLARYEKQILFKPIGRNGQIRLGQSKVGIIGVGALGSNLANILCRAGVGRIILADQDRVELSNLQRQMLFTERDIGHPKAIRAARRLTKINSDVAVEAFFEKVSQENFVELFKDSDLLFDASDNFPTRFLINDMSLKLGIPWVFSGVTASSGQSMLIVPTKTACLGCFIPDEDPGENFPTVNNSGIIASIVASIASISAAAGIKYLMEKTADSNLVYFDVWQQEFFKTKIEASLNCLRCRSEKLRSK